MTDVQRADRIIRDFQMVADATFLATKERIKAGATDLEMSLAVALGMAHQAREILAAVTRSRIRTDGKTLRQVMTSAEPLDWPGGEAEQRGWYSGYDAAVAEHASLAVSLEAAERGADIRHAATAAITAMQPAIDAAVARERERCAGIAEGMMSDASDEFNEAAGYIADAIRKDCQPMTDDKWIEWSGGECPVRCTAMVDVKRRGGEEMLSRPADSWDWGHTPHQHYADIVAYRPLPPKSDRGRRNDE